MKFCHLLCHTHQNFLGHKISARVASRLSFIYAKILKGHVNAKQVETNKVKDFFFGYLKIHLIFLDYCPTFEEKLMPKNKSFQSLSAQPNMS